MKYLFLCLMCAVVLAGCAGRTINTALDDTIDAYGVQTTDNSANSTTKSTPKDTIAKNQNNTNSKIMTDTTTTNSLGAPTGQGKKASAIKVSTNYGDIVIELFADTKPITVENMTQLIEADYYDGTKFHRVIADFMIQGGDPQSKDESLRAVWGTGGPGYQFMDEFDTENKPLVKGSLAMANAGANTNGSQFFIVTAESTPWLDKKHTNFGTVTKGMEVVETIGAVATGRADQPVEDVVIEDIEILSYAN